MAAKKTLWDINKEFQELVEQLDDLIVENGQFVNPETGEVFALDVFDKLELEQEEKMKNCLYVYKEKYPAEIAALDGKINFLQAQVDALKSKKKTLENRRKGFGQYIIVCTKGEKWKAKDKSCSCYTRIFKSTEILDEKLIPKDFMREIPAKYEPDKDKIQEAIESGKNVPGARIKENPVLM